MKYPFLTNNELVLIDYLPGSSGQLLNRLWLELDRKIEYRNENILSSCPINNNPASLEIDIDIVIPKRIVNWFFDKQQPSVVEDYMAFFDMLGTILLAKGQPWNKKNTTSTRFYDHQGYKSENNKIVYSFHSWGKQLPIEEMKLRGCNISLVSIVPKTEEGLQFQKNRAYACYPEIDLNLWNTECTSFNSAAAGYKFDLCSYLVNNDQHNILRCLNELIGKDFNEDKVEFAKTILTTYYEKIVKNV